MKGPPITAREIPPSVHNRGLLNDTRAGDGGFQGAVVDRFRGKADIDFFLVDVQLSRKVSHFTIGKAPPNVITAIRVAELFCIGEVLMSCRGQSCLILLRHNRLTRGLVRSADYQCLSPAFHHPLIWITKSEPMNARRAIIPK